MELAEPKLIFREIALPNYREYRADPLSIRRAYNAAISIAHMADHIAKRPGGEMSPQATREHLKKRNPPFAVVDAMCNAIKHVYATGGGSKQPVVATSTGMTVAGPDRVLFVDEVVGEMRRFVSTAPILVFDYHYAGTSHSVWVAVELYGAVRFIAREIGCDGDLTNDDLPPHLAFRPIS